MGSGMKIIKTQIHGRMMHLVSHRRPLVQLDEPLAVLATISSFTIL